MKRLTMALAATGTAALITLGCHDATGPKAALPPGWEGQWALGTVDGQATLSATFPNDGGQIRYDAFSLQLDQNGQTLRSNIALFSKNGGGAGVMQCFGTIRSEFAGDTVRTSLVEQSPQSSACSPDDFKTVLVRQSNGTLKGNRYGHTVELMHFIRID